MTVDPYALCPCGSGKKLKWCCHELESDMQRVEGLIEKEQTVAALTALEKAARKWPDNAWVLTTKAKLFWQTQRTDEAEAVVGRLLELYPGHPIGLVMRALSVIDAQGAEAGLDAVQKAIFVGGERSPKAVGQLALAAGVALAGASQTFSALQYLRLAGELLPETEQIDNYLGEVNATAAVASVLRDDWRLKSAAVGADHQQAFDDAVALCRRGAWLEGSRRFEELSESLGGCKELWFNLGLCRAWGIDESASDALRRYVALETCEDDAVETEALAQLLDVLPWGPPLDLVTLSFPVRDTEQLTEAFDAEKRLHKLEINREENDDEDEQVVHPESAYLILDRPSGDWRSGLSIDDIALKYGMAEVYILDDASGEHRLEVEFVGEHFEETRDWLVQTAGAALGEPEEPETHPAAAGEPHPIQLHWQLPARTSRQECRRLTNEARERFVRDVWPAQSWSRLGNRSPLDAAKDSKNRVALSAALLLLEEAFYWETLASPVQALRQQLNLPEARPLAVDGLDVDALRLARFGRLPAADLSDDNLVAAFRRATDYRLLPVLLRLGDELLRRAALSERVDMGMVCVELASAAHTLFDTAAAMSYSQRGRQLDATYGRDICAFWDLQDFPLQLMVPNNEKAAEDLLRHIAQQHGEDPAVQEALGKILGHFGLLPEPGRVVRPPAEPEIVVPGGAQAGRIWTPEQEQGPQEAPKIWTPGDG